MMVYYNADKMEALTSTRQRTTLTLILLAGLYVLATCDIYTTNPRVFVRYFLTCMIGIVTIALAEKWLSRTKPRAAALFLSGISMEIYLVHHLFVYDQPLWISLPVTLVLAYLLHLIGKRMKKHCSN